MGDAFPAFASASHWPIWNPAPKWLAFAGWVAAGLLAALALAAALVLFVRRRHRSSQARAARALLGGGTPEQTPPPSCATSISTDLSGRPVEQPALVWSPKVPCVVRALYPIFTAICFAFYIWADLSVAAQVNANVRVNGAPSGKWEWSGIMASLTLVPAAKDAWDSGARATAILLGFLNGLWPFLQTLVLLPLGIRSNRTNQTRLFRSWSKPKHSKHC